jgi:uncharacterized protein
VNPKGTTALMRAAQEGHLDIVTVLVMAGCDVNRKNIEGMNALMLAALKGHSDIITELIRAGARVDEKSTQVSTDDNLMHAL